MSSYEII